MELQVWSRELGDFETNCYVVACPETRECAIIDPGVPDPWIKEVIAGNGLRPVLILLTHGHLDHIGGVDWLRESTGAPVAVHAGDAPMLTDPRRNGSAFFGEAITARAADRLLQQDDLVRIGNLEFRVLHTPGHTPGGICLFRATGKGGDLFAGDTLFAGSIGRTDLAGGSHEVLLQSIRQQLLALPADTLVYPGHGPTTTIGDEREYNPFL